MATDTALLLKHYRDLARTIESFSDGQAKLKERTGDDDLSLDVICVTLAPKTGLYRGGKFDFELDVSTEYPACPPVVHCMTQIYHPNIDFSDESGEVCLNLLDELWTSNMTLEDVVQGLLFLLQNPNIEDPLNCMFTGSEDEEEFQQNVRRSLRGEEVDGVPFERNLSATYDDSDDNKGGDGNETGENWEPDCDSGNSTAEPMKQEAKTGSESTQPLGVVESSVDRNDLTTLLEGNDSTGYPIFKSLMNMAARIGLFRERTRGIETSVDPIR